MKRTMDERFFAKVHMTSECWVWTAAVNLHGYGMFTRGDGRGQVAHRTAFEEIVGPVPEGLCLDHLCRNRRCVRPDHLEPVTFRENVLRGDTLPAANVLKTHCRHGHALTADNVAIKIRRDGVERVCITCRRKECRDRYWRNKAASLSVPVSPTTTPRAAGTESDVAHDREGTE
jgi:hypothetical protein